MHDPQAISELEHGVRQEFFFSHARLRQSLLFE
jgi:hypothetical protein